MIELVRSELVGGYISEALSDPEGHHYGFVVQREGLEEINVWVLTDPATAEPGFLEIDTEIPVFTRTK
jgi:hypothetical protein